MVLFVNYDGTVVNSFPTAVYQQATTGEILIVAPFAQNLSGVVSFTLPNGVITQDYALTYRRNITLTEHGEVKFSGYAWSRVLPEEVTENYGTIEAQIKFFTPNGKRITSSLFTFNVGKGSPSVLPETPSEDIYEQILSAISALRGDMVNGSFTAQGIYGWRRILDEHGDPVDYPAGAIVVADYEGRPVWVRSLVNNNETKPFEGEGFNSWEYLGDIIYDGENRISELENITESHDQSISALENNKLDKVTTPANNRRVYGITTAGAQTEYNISQNTPGVGFLASYTAQKTMRSSPAVASNDLVPKGQMEGILEGYATSASVSINNQTYVMTFKLLNSKGSALFTGTIDLPLEQMIVDTYYDEGTHEVVFVLNNGNSLRVDISDITSGLVNQETFNAAIASIQSALLNYEKLENKLETFSETDYEGYSDADKKRLYVSLNALDGYTQSLKDKVAHAEEVNRAQDDEIDRLTAENKLQAFQIADLKAIVHDTEISDFEHTFDDLDIANHPTHIADAFGQYHPVLPDGACEFVSMEGKSEKWSQIVADNRRNIKRVLALFSSTPDTSIDNTHTVLVHFINNESVSQVRWCFGVHSSQPNAVSYYFNSAQEYNFIRSLKAVDAAADTNAYFMSFNTNSVTLDISEYMIIDLTIIFGAGNEPTSVDDTRIQKLIAYAKAHPEYDAGSIKSVLAEGVQINGQNIWDEEWEVGGFDYTNGSFTTSSTIRSKNYISIVPNQTYYFYGNVRAYAYDKNKTYIGAYVGANTFSKDGQTPVQNTSVKMPSDVYFIKISEEPNYGTTYNHDIAIILGTQGSYTQYKAPFYIPFTSVNRFAHTGNKTQGLFRASFENGKATLTGIATSSETVYFGEETLKAGTYNYKIFNPYNQTVGIYNVTADDWCSTVSSAPTVEGSFTLANDGTVAMGVQTASRNYSGEEIRYMVTKSSYTIGEFVAGNPNAPFDSIELPSTAETNASIRLVANDDGTFKLVSKRLEKYTFTNDITVSLSGTRFFTNLPNCEKPTIWKKGFTDIDFTYSKTGLTVLNPTIGYKAYAYFDGELWLFNPNNTTDREAIKQELIGKTIIYEPLENAEIILADNLTENQVATLIEKYGSVEVVGNTNEEFVKPDVTMLYQVTKAIES